MFVVLRHFCLFSFINFGACYTW